VTELYSPERLRASGVVGVPSPERYWYLLAVAGVFSIGAGVVVLAYPDPSLNVLCVILGVYLLVAGVLSIVVTVSDEDRSSAGMLLGIVALIAGIVVIRHPSQSLVAVALAIGLYFLVAGALDLARAIIGPRRLPALVRGVVLVAAGTVILSSPHITVTTLAVVAGISLCIHGAIQIGEAFVLRSWRGPAA
jgi:uncharacterized membrane protein HdeD (DUF308 family)